MGRMGFSSSLSSLLTHGLCLHKKILEHTEAMVLSKRPPKRLSEGLSIALPPRVDLRIYLRVSLGCANCQPHPLISGVVHLNSQLEMRACLISGDTPPPISRAVDFPISSTCRTEEHDLFA